MEISNKALAFLVLFAIGLSAISTMTLLNKIQQTQPVRTLTGRAPTDTGTINLSVENALSIRLLVSAIDFGSGFVNDSDGCSNATLTIDENGYSDTAGDNCWVSELGTPNEPDSPFVVQNDGNQNVTLSIKGPTPMSFFGDPGTGTEITNLTWKGRNNESDSCGGTGNLISGWSPFDGTDQVVCNNTRFGYAWDKDEIALDIRVIIPPGLTPGEYRNESILFTAS